MSPWTVLMSDKTLATIEALMRVADTQGAADEMVRAFEAFMQAFLLLKADNEEERKVQALKIKNSLAELVQTIAKAQTATAAALAVKDGYTPVPGVDFPSQKQFGEIIRGMIPPPVPGKTPVLGVDFKVPTTDQVAELMANKYVTSSEIFKVIFNLPDNVIMAINGGESQIKPERIEGLAELMLNVKKKYWQPFWAGNGGGPASSGTGVGAWSTPAESPDSSNLIFTVGSSAPTDVISDGVNLFNGAGYTYAAGQITFVNPPTQYVRYR